MELEQAIRTRRATREFTAEPVDQSQLRSLIELAVLAPSAMNTQTWSFSVVRDRELLQKISDASKRHLLQTSSAGALSGELGQMLENAKFQIFYHAPAMILISGMADDPWSQIDCALAAENLMLAAADAGLGTCWIGFAQGWLGTDEGKATLGQSASSVPVAPIIVGHPKAPAQAVPRKEPAVNWIG
jgi:nitroreductase